MKALILIRFEKHRYIPTYLYAIIITYIDKQLVFIFLEFSDYSIVDMGDNNCTSNAECQPLLSRR